MAGRETSCIPNLKALSMTIESLAAKADVGEMDRNLFTCGALLT